MKKIEPWYLAHRELPMSKNKIFQTLFTLVLGSMVISVSAQSIGELAEAAKLRQLSGSVAPGTAPSSAGHPDPTPSKASVKSSTMLVTSVFTSKESNQAGISINGAEVFVRVGDGLISGWVVSAISNDEVLLKRCSGPKRCETKKLTYTLTN